MSFRHDLMLSGGNHERLVRLARARGVETDAVLCEALRSYIDEPSLYAQSIPLTVDGPRVYINCTLPDDLRTALAIAVQAHTVRPSGVMSAQTVFTRAVQHYFNQLAAAPAADDTPRDIATHDIPNTPSPYAILHTRAARHGNRFKL